MCISMAFFMLLSAFARVFPEATQDYLFSLSDLIISRIFIP